MPTSVELLTFEDLERLPEEPGKTELLDGVDPAATCKATAQYIRWKLVPPPSPTGGSLEIWQRGPGT